MSDDLGLKTLLYPFESGELDLPPADAKGIFLNAKPGLRFPDGFPSDITCIQGFRPDYLALQRDGRMVLPQPDGSACCFALILTDRHRGANELRIADALECVSPGGLVLVAGGKEDGIVSLRKRREALIEIDGSLSKFHGLAFWFRAPHDGAQIAGHLRETWRGMPVDDRFSTAPGMFSHDRVDAGSKLLAQHLPAVCRGTAADFCAGWGYLSALLADHTSGLKSIDLYEADHASLEAARANLSAISGTLPFAFHWQDLIAEPVSRKYDLIVMNPPFHQGRAAEPQIGQSMIKAAASSLKGGGRLFMVANRGLPYDMPLSTGFAAVRELARGGAFRVIEARR